MVAGLVKNLAEKKGMKKGDKKGTLPFIDAGRAAYCPDVR
jgi:hypothetical protein